MGHCALKALEIGAEGMVSSHRPPGFQSGALQLSYLGITLMEEGMRYPKPSDVPSDWPVRLSYVEHKSLRPFSASHFQDENARMELPTAASRSGGFLS